jgi:hypothetical protein
MQRSPRYTRSAPQQPVQLLDLPYILELGTLDPVAPGDALDVPITDTLIRPNNCRFAPTIPPGFVPLETRRRKETCMCARVCNVCVTSPRSTIENGRSNLTTSCKKSPNQTRSGTMRLIPREQEGARSES